MKHFLTLIMWLSFVMALAFIMVLALECFALAVDKGQEIESQIQDIKMQEDDFKVTITWTWRDIQTLRPDWSEDECKSYLMEVSKTLQDRSIEVGWIILEEFKDTKDTSN